MILTETDRFHQLIFLITDFWLVSLRSQSVSLEITDQKMIENLTVFQCSTPRRVSEYGGFSGLHFPNICDEHGDLLYKNFQSKNGKIQNRKFSYSNTFYEVLNSSSKDC